VETHVRERLELLASDADGAQAYRNIRDEERFEQAHWDVLIGALYSEKSVQRGFIKARITTAMRTIMKQWPFPGGPTSLSPTMMYARAVTTEAFARTISRQPAGTTPQTLLKAIRHQVTYGLRKLKRHWCGRGMGEHLMWATFEPASTNPFRHDFSCARDMRACLGLPDEPGPVIRLIYGLPSTACFPTVAEAYAGDAWNYHFMPSPKGSPAGNTLPWSKTLDPHHEVVHSIVTADELLATPQELA
jgi:hypothetical protein